MDLGNLLSSLGALFFIWLGLTAVAVTLGLWLLYTIIWRAVRRGMREYRLGEDAIARTAAASPSTSRPAPRRSWSLGASEPVRREPGPRDW